MLALKVKPVFRPAAGCQHCRPWAVAQGGAKLTEIQVGRADKRAQDAADDHSADGQRVGFVRDGGVHVQRPVEVLLLLDGLDLLVPDILGLNLCRLGDWLLAVRGRAGRSRRRGLLDRRFLLHDGYYVCAGREFSDAERLAAEPPERDTQPGRAGRAYERMIGGRRGTDVGWEQRKWEKPKTGGATLLVVLCARRGISNKVGRESCAEGRRPCRGRRALSMRPARLSGPSEGSDAGLIEPSISGRHWREFEAKP